MAQGYNSDYDQGSSKLSIGLGFPNKTHEALDIGTTILGGLLSGNAAVNDKGGKSTPFFMGMYEYGISENISLGAYAGYFKSENEILRIANLITNSKIGTAEYKVYSFGGKIGAHYPLIKNLDTYASTYVGYNFIKDDVRFETGSLIGDLVAAEIVRNLDYPRITYEVNAGAKYFFNEKIGVYGEAGVGRFLVNAGVSFNLN